MPRTLISMVLLCGACAGSPDDLPATCANSEATVAIGTGSTAFEAIYQDDPLVMIHGPQGGWHVLVAMELEYMSPIVEADVRVTDQPSDQVVSQPHFRVAPTPTAECTGTYVNMFAVLDVPRGSTALETFGYHPFLIELDVVDSLDRVASSSVRVTAVPDPADIED